MVSGWALLLHIMLAGTSVIWELCWDGSLTMSHVSCLNREDLHASAQESLFPPFSSSLLLSPLCPLLFLLLFLPLSSLLLLLSLSPPPSVFLISSPLQITFLLYFVQSFLHDTWTSYIAAAQGAQKGKSQSFQTFLRLRSHISTEKHSN